jgi:Helicase associated domain
LDHRFPQRSDNWADQVDLLTETRSWHQMEGWRHGLASGGGGDWAARLAQLRDYQGEHGDAHAGYRAGDDAELGRWATAQRSAAAEGHLPADRYTAAVC